MTTYKKIINQFFPLIAVAVFLLLWLAAAKIIGVEMILPTPGETLKEFIRLTGEPAFWQATANTLIRSLISFAVSFGLALILSVLAYLVPIVYKLLSPLIVIVRSTPTISIILLAIIWMTQYTSPVFITVLIIFPLLYAGFLGGLTSIDKDLIAMSKLYKVPMFTRIKELYIPNMLPSVFVSSRSSISLTVKIMISAEVLAQTGKSMGNFMQLSKIYLETGELLAWTAAAVIISYLLELAILLIQKTVVRWK